MHSNEQFEERLKDAEVLLIGCSAGGFNIVYELLLSLPENFPLSVVVVIHRSRKHKSSIEALLHKRAKVPVKLAEDQEMIKKSVVYFAPSDYHLLLEPNGTFTLDSSEPLFYCRPAIDITFESVCDIYKDRTIAILLSGANEDGADGIAYVEQNQGIAVVQAPIDAEVKTMPQAAIKKGKNVLVLTNQEIFELIAQINDLKTTLTQDGKN